MKPKQIKKDADNLIVIWTNGETTKIKLTTLRFLCPCAVCAADRENVGDHYVAVYSSSQINLKGIKDVGNYAIKFEWEDGHNTGFYEYEYLYNIMVNHTV